MLKLKGDIMDDQAEKKSKKPEWYLLTIRRLSQYPEDKKRLCILNAQLGNELPKTTASYSLTPASTKTSDQTAGIASKRWETAREINECTLRIREIDIILAGFGEDERKIIEYRYFSKHNYDWWVAKQMKIPLRTYYRVRDELLSEVAILLGIYKRD
ncbi:hypothetical protein [Desulfosporosinus meridiei]|uniref:Phage transcriptional regulator, RinA family n=1 Tax=Desulfosporosinus meridiei (strain ATCC BAA-275 / DSM 13257 / KCTC 12902 / NCIMB 13706 / S10) TaxID=768704 RepID=J7J2F6_DESMD|nr:hypothetical protein [Desulfosporosinus meridiei]AFQ45161.1 hypothetical protein Desmer_3284 [Desulfosporosinus meridiei DSM 13257]